MIAPPRETSAAPPAVAMARVAVPQGVLQGPGAEKSSGREARIWPRASSHSRVGREGQAEGENGHRRQGVEIEEVASDEVQGQAQDHRHLRHGKDKDLVRREYGEYLRKGPPTSPSDQPFRVEQAPPHQEDGHAGRHAEDIEWVSQPVDGGEDVAPPRDLADLADHLDNDPVHQDGSHHGPVHDTQRRQHRVHPIPDRLIQHGAHAPGAAAPQGPRPADRRPPDPPPAIAHGGTSGSRPTQTIPAALAARMPPGESSITTHRVAGTPSPSAARRNGSGSGFPLTQSSRVTMCLEAMTNAECS